MAQERIKILAIDDIEDNLLILQAIIDEAFDNAIVFTALSGAKGLELAKSINPDIILLDIVMPIMDGYKVCEILKNDSILKDIPVVFVTANNDDKENRIHALNVGAEAFLSKPIDESELIAQIRAMYKVRKANLQKANESNRLEELVTEKTTELNATISILKHEKNLAQRYLSELKEVGNIFENSIENAPLPIMIHAEDGTVLNLSKMWTTLTHYEKSDIPTIYEWTSRAYGKNKDEVIDFIKMLYSLTKTQHDGEFIVTTKDGRKLTWDFNSGYIGNLPDGRAVAMSVATDVTDRIAREQENIELIKKVKNTETLLKASLESPKDMIILSIDTDYNYNYFNENHKKTMISMYGSVVEIGSNILDQITILQDRKTAKSSYRKVLAGEAYSVVDSYGENKDIYYESYYYPIYDARNIVIGASVFARDISEKRKQQQALKNSEEKYRLLSEMLPLGMVHYKIVRNTEKKRMDFQVLGVNKVFEQIAGMKNSDLVGRNVWDIFPDSEQYWIDEFEKVANSGNTSIFEEYSVSLDSYIKIYAYKISADEMAVTMENVTEDRKNQEKIKYISYHDSLTDLSNRRYYEDNLIKLDVPENYPLTIVMSDINGLKLINDAFGHTAGDKLLVSAANLISDSCRDTDLVARIGGDEFVIVMPNTSETEAEKIINKINKNAKKVTIESIELSISFGYKTKNELNEDIQEVYRSAEDLMYRVKLIEIPSMRSGAIETILNTLYEKDKNSEIHSRTVSSISEKIAVAYGMNGLEVAEVKTAGLLHDIGKIIIPISIIIKEGKLTSDEYDLIKGHPEIGFRILNSTHDMRNISNIVLSHHERWDGLGYPRGIKTDEIPLQSRIIAIADAFDAMTSVRTYRETSSNERALDEIIKNSGTQFDPEVVQVFVDNFKSIIELKD